MNQYWWGNINKAAKSAYHTCLTCQSTNLGSWFVLHPGQFKLHLGQLRSGKWISYKFLHLMHISMF